MEASYLRSRILGEQRAQDTLRTAPMSKFNLVPLQRRHQLKHLLRKLMGKSKSLTPLSVWLSTFVDHRPRLGTVWASSFSDEGGHIRRGGVGSSGSLEEPSQINHA